MRIAIQGLVSLINNAKNGNEVVKEAIEVWDSKIRQSLKSNWFYSLLTPFIIFTFTLIFKDNIS